MNLLLNEDDEDNNNCVFIDVSPKSIERFQISILGKHSSNHGFIPVMICAFLLLLSSLIGGDMGSKCNACLYSCHDTYQVILVMILGR